MGKRAWQLASAANHCGMRDGSVAAAQVVAQAFATDASDDTILISLDMTNAYGTVNKQRIQEHVRRVTPNLEHLFLSLYGRDSHLYYRTECNRILRLTGGRGVPQGAPSSSGLFGLAIAGCLARVRKAFPEILITAFADDICLVGECTKAAEAAACLSRLLAQEVDLCTNRTKTQVLCRAGVANLERVRDKLDTLLGGNVDEVISPAMVQNTLPLRLLGACITSATSLAQRESAEVQHLHFSLMWLRREYGSGLQSIQRGVEVMGALATVQYVNAVLTPGLCYRDAAAGPTEYGMREALHSMVIHGLVIKSLRLQADPYVSSGCAESGNFDETSGRWSLMCDIDNALSCMLGLTKISEGEVNGDAPTWEGEIDMEEERVQWLELLGANPYDYSPVYQPTPHRELMQGGAYAEAFETASRLSTEAGGIGLASIQFFINCGVAGWVQVMSRGCGCAFDTSYVSPEDLDMMELATADVGPSVVVPTGDLRTIGEAPVAEPAEGFGEPGIQPSEVLLRMVEMGYNGNGTSCTVIQAFHKKEGDARDTNNEIWNLACKHNGCALHEREMDDVDASADEAAELDSFHSNDLVFGQHSWLSQKTMMKARQVQRKAFGEHTTGIVDAEFEETIRDQLTEAVTAEGELMGTQIVHHVQQQMWYLRNGARWRRLLFCITGFEFSSVAGAEEHAWRTAAVRCLTDEQVAKLDSMIYDKTKLSVIDRGAESRVKWLKALCATDANTDRIKLVLPMLKEFSAAVDAVRMEASEMQNKATVAEIKGDDTCSRMLRRLAHARDTWNPGTTGWLRQLVTRGPGRLTDEAFIQLLRYRLTTSHCNYLIADGEERLCGCISRDVLRGSGDPTTQFHLSRCGAGKARTISWHNRIKRTLAAMLQSLNMKVVQEPRHYVPKDDRFQEQEEDNDNRRPDLHVKDTRTGVSALVDVTVTSFTNKASIARAFRRPMSILDAAAKRKHDVYKNAPNTNQLQGELVAFVVSSSGVIGKEGLRWLKQVIRPYLATLDRVQERRWRHFWFSSLAEACMVGLAEQMTSQTARLSAQVIRSGQAAEGVC